MDGAKERDIRFEPPRDFKAIPGKGAQAVVDGKNVKVVSPGYLKENNLVVENDRVHKVAEQGKTVVYVLVENTVEGAVALADIIRPESKEALRRLKRMGVRAEERRVGKECRSRGSPYP